ncbi:hypothetical protein SGRA_3820 [Saprospira grandis str. Lewin]|uniref:Uncharacterized protein n=1 Tax=Saprospira grandis (strain Lewin) TaxID=984262 RepID=H6L5X6_SAPGL|nr:hypothetical protein SGRA_3820 [Saprospira grandis str. Lewin]
MKKTQLPQQLGLFVIKKSGPLAQSHFYYFAFISEIVRTVCCNFFPLKRALLKNCCLIDQKKLKND